MSREDENQWTRKGFFRLKSLTFMLGTTGTQENILNGK